MDRTNSRDRELRARAAARTQGVKAVKPAPTATTAAPTTRVSARRTGRAS